MDGNEVFAWAVLAVLLLIVEMLTGTVYLLAWAFGLGVGALVQWVTGSWRLAALAAAVVIIAGSLWARHVRVSRMPVRMDDPDAGGEARLLRATHSGQWRVAFRGAEWDARIVSGAERAEVDSVGVVVGRDANVLKLEIR